MRHAVTTGLEQVLLKKTPPLFVQIGNKLFVFLDENIG